MENEVESIPYNSIVTICPAFGSDVENVVKVTGELFSLTLKIASTSPSENDGASFSQTKHWISYSEYIPFLCCTLKF